MIEWYVCNKHSYSFSSAQPCRYCESPAPSSQESKYAERIGGKYTIEEYDDFLDRTNALPPKLDKPIGRPRNWWIGCGRFNEPDAHKISAFFYGESDPRKDRMIYDVGEWVRVIEVLPNSIQVTREQLAKAWRNHSVSDTSRNDPTSFFNCICKELGFPEDSKE